MIMINIPSEGGPADPEHWDLSQTVGVDVKIFQIKILRGFKFGCRIFNTQTYFALDVEFKWSFLQNSPSKLLSEYLHNRVSTKENPLVKLSIIFKEAETIKILSWTIYWTQ